MTGHLFGVKPLLEPMLTSCQLDPGEQTSLKFNNIHIFFLKKIDGIAIVIVKKLIVAWWCHMAA